MAISRAELLNGKGESALERLWSLVKQQPASIPVLYQLASTQALLGQSSEAEETFGHILILDEDNPSTGLGLARLHLIAKRYQETIEAAQAIQASHPENADAYALEGDALVASGNPQAAVKSFQSALTHERRRPFIISLSRAHKAAGNNEAATKVLVDWLVEHPKDVAAQSLLADFSLVSGKTQEAIKRYEQIIESTPNNIGVLNNLANLYHQQDDPRAFEHAEKAYELAPNHPVIMDTYGWLLVERGELELGLPILEESAGRTPENTEHQWHLGVALFKAQRLSEARMILQSLIDDERDLPEKARAKELLELVQ